jgi:transposase
MRKTDPNIMLNILKLSEESFSSRQIAGCLGCSKTTARDVINRADQHGITYAKMVEMGTAKTIELLYPPRKRKPIESAVIEKHKKLCEDAHVNRRSLWEEYIKENPDGVKYPQFCLKMKRLGTPRHKYKRHYEKRAL